VDVDTGGGEPGDDRGLEELPRDPRVAADNGDGPTPATNGVVEGAGLAEDVRCGDRQVHGELGGQCAVREPSDPVGPEETSHYSR
jgi:hypothetical protein